LYNPLSNYRLFKMVVEQLPKLVRLSDDGIIGRSFIILLLSYNHICS